MGEENNLIIFYGAIGFALFFAFLSLMFLLHYGISRSETSYNRAILFGVFSFANVLFLIFKVDGFINRLF